MSAHPFQTAPMLNGIRHDSKGEPIRCSCTFHPRKPHVDPCRACHSKHVRSARPGENAVLRHPGAGPSGRRSRRTQGPRDRAFVPTAASEDARPVGPSPDPALRLATEPRRARRVRAGSTIQSSGERVSTSVGPPSGLCALP